MLRTAFLTAITLASGAALAQQPTGPYIGLLGGTSDISREVTEDYTHKDDKFTWGASLGWQFTSNLAAEIAYLKPGNLSLTEIDGEDVYSVTGKLHGFSANAILSLPFADRWSVHARVGAVRAREKYRASVNDETVGTFSDTTTEVIYGGGIGVIIEGARFRLEYQRAEFEAGKIGLISLGINWFLPTGK